MKLNEEKSQGKIRRKLSRTQSDQALLRRVHDAIYKKNPLSVQRGEGKILNQIPVILLC